MITEALSVFKYIDPTTTLLVIIILGYVISKYRENIKNFLKTYFKGVSVEEESNKKDNKETEEEVIVGPNTMSNNLIDLTSSIDKLSNNLIEVREQQKIIVDNQSKLTDRLDNIETTINEFTSNSKLQLSMLNKKTDFLTNSDREDKKAYIVREYNYFYIRLKKIDMYSRETLDKIHDLYLEEDGDTFITSLMTAIRTLPVVNQITQEDIDKANEEYKKTHPDAINVTKRD